MADPFSIAGSTVGVVSLDADQDIQSISNKAAGLRVPLKTLRDILEEYEFSDPETHPWTIGSSAQSDIRDDLKDKVQVIVAAIERLKESINKYGPSTAQGHGRFRAGYKKLGVCGASYFLLSEEIFVANITKLVKFLVESGTPVDTTTRSGQTALDILCHAMRFSTGNRALVKYLIDRGGNFVDMSNMRFKPSRLLLQEALSYDEDKMVKIILQQSEPELRAALNSKLVNVNGTIQSLTLLEIIVGWPRGVQILLEAGVDIERYPSVPHDPISQAIRLQCRESLCLLLQAG
ncbi:hypothetical protein BJX62DRAFT_239957 [Aspergillus germanicus]